MTKKTGPLAAAILASLLGTQTLAADTAPRPAPPALKPAFAVVTTSFCPQGTPRETAYINIRLTARKPGMSDEEALRAYRSDIVSLTRRVWRNAMQGFTLDELMYREDIYRTEPHRYQAYNPAKEEAFDTVLKSGLKQALDDFKDKTGAEVTVDTNIILIQPGCLMGG